MIIWFLLFPLLGLMDDHQVFIDCREEGDTIKNLERERERGRGGGREESRKGKRGKGGGKKEEVICPHLYSSLFLFHIEYFCFCFLFHSFIFFVGKYFLFKFNLGDIISWILFQVWILLQQNIKSGVTTGGISSRQEIANIQMGWYFFTPIDSKYSNGIRPNRRTLNGYGYWKATDVEKPIENSASIKIGVWKALVFYIGKPRKGEKTEWIMYEYIKQDPSDPLRKLDGTMQANIKKIDKIM